MNKADIAEKLANQAGLTKRASREVIDVVTSVVMDTLARGEKVTLSQVCEESILEFESVLTKFPFLLVF